LNRKTLAAAIALATLAAAPAFAAPAAPYISVAIGGSDTDIDCTGTDSCNNHALAAKVIGGYDFGNQFALEAMYVSLGEPKGTVGGADVGVESHYWGLGGAFRPAFNREWSGVVRLGVAFTSSRAKVGFLDLSGSQSYDSTNAYVGAGVAYAINKDMKIEADLDSTQVAIGNGSDKQTARVIDYTVGLTYSF
jgi:OOP family OmpA-OmpF porin